MSVHMRRLAAPVMVMVAALGSGAAHADQHDFQAWANVTYQGRIQDRLMGWAEAQTRFGEDAGRLSQYLIRPGLGYEIQPGLVVWVGYARIGSITTASAVGENRIWQQLSWTVGKLFDGTFSSRSRLEQRFQENGNSTGLRARQFLRYEHPFFAGSDMSAILTSETFFALNRTDWGAHSGFDQIRNFVGVGLTAFPNARLELGYMNQYIQRPGPVNRSNHMLSVNLLGRF